MVSGDPRKEGKGYSLIYSDSPALSLQFQLLGLAASQDRGENLDDVLEGIYAGAKNVGGQPT